MLVNANALDLVYRGFQTIYTDAYDKAPAHALEIAMEVPSVSREETYGWMGQFPQMREWIGQRVIHGLSAHSFTIQNLDFESTVGVARNDIEDDRLGVFKPVFSEMGWQARQHPERMIFGLLAKGFESLCYNGQNFFDTDHPLVNENNQTVSFSNMQAGSDPAWFLLDTSRTIRPIVWQVRKPYAFVAMDKPSDPHVFLNKEFVYGVDARVNAGFGLPQLAFGSKAPLTAANYAAARAAMMDYRSDNGRVLGIMPDTLVVPPALEAAALEILNSDRNVAGATNVWRDTAKRIVTPFLTAA